MAEELASRASDPARVDAYINTLVHPLKEVLTTLREAILEADPSVGEEIKWNAPTFFFTGPLPPSDPKEYRRYLVVSNLFKKDAIRLVFWQGAKVGDTTGLLTGDYKDGRRLAEFRSLHEVHANKEKLQNIVREQVLLVQPQSHL